MWSHRAAQSALGEHPLSECLYTHWLHGLSDARDPGTCRILPPLYVATKSTTRDIPNPKIQKVLKLCECVRYLLLITMQFLFTAQILSEGVKLTPKNSSIFRFCVCYVPTSYLGRDFREFILLFRFRASPGTLSSGIVEYDRQQIITYFNFVITVIRPR